jgi:hypothetical protein
VKTFAPALLLLLPLACGKGTPHRLLPPPPPSCQCTAAQKCLADGSTCADLNYVDPVGAAATCPDPVVAAGGIFGPDTSPGVVRPVGAPIVGAGETLIDLGVVRVGTVLQFSVPADTASFTIVEQAAAATVPDVVGSRFPNVAVPDQLRDPAGTVIYDDINVPTTAQMADPAAANLLTFFASFASTTTGTFTFPSTSRALRVVEVGGIAAGTWSFVANDWAYECFRFPSLCAGTSGTNSSDYQVHVILKRAGTGTKNVPATGTLDLAVHMVDSTAAPTQVGIVAADALTNPRLQRFVRQIGRLLSGGGVCLGSVTFYDSPTWARDAFATGVNASDSGFGGSLAQLSALSGPEPAGVTTPRLHLFLVSRILSSSTNGTSVVGIDGTIPGPGAVNGTVRSGAAVSMENILAEQGSAAGACGSPDLDIGCGADFTAYVAAHEAGHFLGLYHVTESTGADHDPMADTPRCACSLCASTPADCGASTFVLGQSTCNQGVEPCSGGRNLMFWLLGSRSLTRGILSPDQGQVIRTSPAVSHP